MKGVRVMKLSQDKYRNIRHHLENHTLLSNYPSRGQALCMCRTNIDSSYIVAVILYSIAINENVFTTLELEMLE